MIINGAVKLTTIIVSFKNITQTSEGGGGYFERA